MPRAVTRLYIEALPQLYAEEQLGAMQVADFPHLEERDRRRLYDALIDVAEVSASPSLDPQRDKAVLAGMGIGVRVGDD